MNLYDGEREELYTIRQDVMDPIAQHAGIQTGLSGCETEIRLDGAKIEVPIRWRDRLTVADVYEMDDHIAVHLYCPQCTQGLMIESRKKRIRFNKGERRIDIAEIHCTYPSCDWRAVIEDNVAVDPPPR